MRLGSVSLEIERRCEATSPSKSSRSHRWRSAERLRVDRTGAGGGDVWRHLASIWPQSHFVTHRQVTNIVTPGRQRVVSLTETLTETIWHVDPEFLQVTLNISETETIMYKFFSAFRLVVTIILTMGLFHSSKFSRSSARIVTTSGKRGVISQS